MQINSHKFIGKHILGELYGIPYDIINDLDYMKTLLIKGTEEANATICETIAKRFDPQGLTVLILLSESHVSVHTYPENNSVFFDIFTCGIECDPDKFVKKIIEELKPAKEKILSVKRGNEDESK